jgi:hypothetical protein
MKPAFSSSPTLPFRMIELLERGVEGPADVVHRLSLRDAGAQVSTPS